MIRAQALRDVEAALLSGERKNAVGLCVQYGMWAEALALSSFMDKVPWFFILSSLDMQPMSFNIAQTTYEFVLSQFADSEFPEDSPLRTLFLVFGGQEKRAFSRPPDDGVSFLAFIVFLSSFVPSFSFTPISHLPSPLLLCFFLTASHSP